MSWWDLFRQTTHGLSARVFVATHESNSQQQATVPSSADQIASARQRDRTIRDRAYLAARTYWSKSRSSLCQAAGHPYDSAPSKLSESRHPL